MDLTKLSLGDKVMAGGGIVLFIASFLPWFGKDFGNGFASFSYEWNGWDVGFFTGTLPAIIGLVLVAYVVVTKVLDGVTLPDLPVGWPLVVLGLAGLAALLVLARLLIGAEVGGVDIDLDRKYGIFVATIGALAAAGGAFLKFQEDGGELPTKGGGGSSGGDGGAPTPF